MKQFTISNQLTAIGKRLAMVLTMLLIVGIGQAWAGEATLHFDDTSKRTVFNENQQVWVDNGITFTVNKSSSNTNVNNSTSTNPIRIYGGASATIECAHGNITTIEVTCSPSGYATELKNSVGNEATASGSVVTITPTASSTTYSIASFTAQTRVNSITVTYQDAAPAHTIIAVSNSESYGTVSLTSTTITATPKTGYRVSTTTPYTISPLGSATVEQNGNTFTVTPSANTTITINFEAIPTHKVDFNTGGLVDIESVDVQEGQTYNITQTPASSLTQECEYNTFVGWTKSNTIANPSSKPTIVNSIEMESSDITLYAVYSKTEGGGGSAAEQGTTMFSENWTGCTNNTQPDEPTEFGSAVYNAADIDYVWYTPSGGSKTQTYTSGGPNNNANILISKNNGYWKVVGIPTGQAETLTLSSSKSGSGVLSVSTSTSNVSISGSTITIGSSSVNTFDLIFTNTKSGDNLRLDDISVVVAKAGATGSTTYSLTPECTTETIVTLDPHGGTISNTDGWTENGDGTYSKTHEGTEIALPTATKTNYIFDGWYKEETKYETIPADLTESITLTAKWSDKQDPEIAWNPTTCTVTIDAGGQLPIFQNPNELTGITFTSSHPSVASVDENGLITLGTTATTTTVTITATFEGNNTYAAKEVTCTLTVHPSNCRWVETEIGKIEPEDEVLVTMRLYNGDTYTLDHSKGTSELPPAQIIAINGNEATFLSLHNNSIWNISGNATDGYILYPNGSETTWLYCTKSNKNVKVGTTQNNVFAIDNGYLKHTNTTESWIAYLGVYINGVSTVWHHENSPTATSITGQTLKFYKRECLDSEHYWVTWDAGEGLWTDGSSKKLESYTVGAAITEPENPTREGYRFDGWTPTPGTMPAENKTFTAQWAELHTITWMVGSSSVLSEDVANGTGVIQTPASNPEGDAIGDCADTFLGWSEKSAGSTPQDAAYYDDLCTAAQMKANHTSVTGDKTFYAVFATEEAGGGENTAQVFATSSLGNSNSVTTGYAISAEAEKKTGYYQDGSGTKRYVQVMKSNVSTSMFANTPTSVTITAKLGGGTTNNDLTNSVYAIWLDKDGNELGNAVLITDKITATTGSDFTVNLPIANTTSAYGVRVYHQKETGYNVRYYAISLSYKYNNTTYSNYVTNCCALAPVTNLTVSGTTANSATLTWTAPSSTTGITKLQVRNAETDEVVVDNIVAINTTTATITGLTECTSYQYYVVSVGEDCEVVSNIVTAQPFGSAKTVNYDYNGGNGSPASFTTNCTNQTITLPDATRTGYDFNGWYTDATGGTRVGGANDTYEPATSPVTLYAQWTKQIYRISFDANGGSGTMANQSADENDVVAQLNANQFTRSGYVFVGWNTSTSGTGTAYIDQQTNITLTQNLTLYAQWAPVVTLNDAGNEETAHPTAVNGTITLPNGANACDPYEFVGWTSVAIADWNGEIEEPELVTSPYKPTAPITLYAVYKIQDEGNPNAFKLSFEGGNGKTYYVGSYNSSPYLRGYSNITEEEAVTFIRTKMYPNDDTRYYLHMEHTGEYLYYTGSLNSTSSTPSENQGWVFHTVGDKIKLQSTYSYDPDYLSFSDRDQETINISTSTSGSEFNMLSAVTSTYVASPLCNQEIEIIFETGNGNFVDNAPATNPLTVSRGDVITLPTCEYPGYEFMGWMKDEQQLDPSDIIGTYYTGDYTVDGVSSTITFYAYYKAIPEEVEFTGKDDVELLMYYYDGTANYYYASSLDGGNGELPSMQNCFNATTWTFTNVGNMQYHIQDETGKYLGAVNDNDNDLSLSNTPKVWNFTLVNGLWKMVCEDSPSRALMYISTGKKFANAAISNEGNGAYSYVTLGICPYPTYTTNPVLSQGFSITNTAMVTSASGQKVKATSALTLETRNIELPCTFTIAAPNITFYDNTGAEVTQLTASAASEQFELHFAYQPTAENTMEYPTVTITDDEMKTYTIKNRISARSLPAVFVIAAKTGNSWVALNANITSTGTQAAPLIMVDNIALPTKATITPNTTKYQLLGLQTDKPSNANSRFKNNGAAIHLYSTNVSKVISASTSTDNKKTYINADAAHDDAASSSNCLFYEWQLQTNDLVHYTLVNSNTTNTSNTKLGYSATYAQWGMYQTGNNVIQEVLLLPIEKDITEMDVEVMEWGTNSMALRFGSEAPATVDITLGATTTKGLSLANLNSGNTSDIYKVEGLSLAGNDCEALLITDATDASKGKLIRKPILVSGDKNGSDYTIAPTRDVCMHSDIVILNGGKLTADEAKTVGYHVDFANIYVYPGGKLVLDEKSLGVKQQVYLRGGYSWLNQSTYALPEVYLNGDINFNGSGNMIYDYYIQNQKYYQFALPYDVQLANVTDESGADDFPVWVKHYNGALRAADAYATSWEWYPSEEGDAKAYFKEGEGYIIAAKPRQVGNVANRPLSIIRFPLGNKAFNSTNGIETDLTITTTAHGIDGYKAGTITANNVGWNFVGNPFMATWKGDIGHKELAKHPDENNWDGSYHWVDSDVKYITIMSPEDGSDYAQYIASNTELKPFFPFYIQETADGGGTINFAAANRVKKAPALWNVEQDEREAYIQIEIAMDAVADQTGVFVSNKYSDEIDFDDYGKMFGSSTDKPKVWLVHDNTRLAFEAMTENRATGMTPLGYRVPQDGKYMLVLNDEVSQLNNVESIYLTDYKTGVTDYDLTLSTYEFESTTTLYNDTRFAIRVVMRDNTQGPITGVENVNTDNGQIHKFIYLGKIYILHHGVIYDATGKRVITINK